MCAKALRGHWVPTVPFGSGASVEATLIPRPAQLLILVENPVYNPALGAQLRSDLIEIERLEGLVSVISNGVFNIGPLNGSGCTFFVGVYRAVWDSVSMTYSAKSPDHSIDPDAATDWLYWKALPLFWPSTGDPASVINAVVFNMADVPKVQLSPGQALMLSYACRDLASTFDIWMLTTWIRALVRVTV